MATMYDGESKTGHDVENIHCKRPREETNWNAEASQELLRLRFRELRDLFDDAQTVADVHEAWGVVASTLSSKNDWGLQVDAVKCSDQLTKLRKQWQESSTTQLHLMMAECFSKSVVVPQQQQLFEQPPPLPARNNFNRALQDALMQEAEAKTAVDAPKRSKTVAARQIEEEAVLPPPDSVPSAQVKTFSSSEVAFASPEPASITAHEVESSTVILHDNRLLLVPEPLAVSPQQVAFTPQEALLTVAPVEEEEFHRHGEIMRALEKRSQQLEKLTQSHKHLAEVTQQLMEALVNRNID